LERDLLVVGEAANEFDVMEIMERTEPDILLLDLDLPKRGAVPILLYLTEKHVRAKVFVLSLFPEKEDILDTAKAGACAYALKRTSSATIIQAIRRMHRGEIWVDNQLNCAEVFTEFARQRRNRDGTGLDDAIMEVLSNREFEILTLVAKGLTNHQISQGLFISLRTVKVHLNHVFNKLHVNNRTQAALLFMHSYRNGSIAALCVISPA
jgi:DNA-binding NarL/FixJ family response regulator